MPRQRMWTRSACLAMLLAGCGEMLNISLPFGPTLVGVALRPEDAFLAPGDTQRFYGYGLMSDSSMPLGPIMTFSATGGTLTKTDNVSALYTAGQNVGRYRVIAATPAESGGTFADTSVVTIYPTLAGVVVEPEAVVLAPGSTQVFGTHGVMSDGSITNGVLVTYSATGGTLTHTQNPNNVLYTAGQSPGNYQVIAAAPSAGGAFADTATVTITVP